MAHWQGMEDGPSAQGNDDYADTASLDCLTQLYDKDVLSRETLAAFAVRLGVLPDAFNYDEEVARRARDAASDGIGGPSLAQRFGVGGGSWMDRG